MADNTKQAWWIVVLWGNLTVLFRDVAKVFIAMDLLWYPIEGDDNIRAAPDVFVALGRPRGHRGSYRQWEEDNVAPQVVFEILSPGNTGLEMVLKHLFYEDHGVQEYYLYDPEKNTLVVYLREGEMLRPRRIRTHFISPLLQIRFDLSGEEMVVSYPAGRRFLTFEELESARLLAEEQATKARQEADEATQRADEARQQADEARQQADEARQQADHSEQGRRRALELGRKARLGQASAAELLELEQLENETLP